MCGYLCHFPPLRPPAQSPGTDTSHSQNPAFTGAGSRFMPYQHAQGLPLLHIWPSLHFLRFASLHPSNRLCTYHSSSGRSTSALGCSCSTCTSSTSRSPSNSVSHSLCQAQAQARWDVLAAPAQVRHHFLLQAIAYHTHSVPLSKVRVPHPWFRHTPTAKKLTNGTRKKSNKDCSVAELSLSSRPDRV